MKKPILLALALAIGGISSVASAQMPGRPNSSSPTDMPRGQMPAGPERHDMDRDHQRMSDQNNHAGNAVEGGRRRMDPPGHWNRGRPAWSQHAKRCAARYRSYNPRNDMFMVRRGVMRRCML